MRHMRRTLAPLLAGALFASVLVVAAEAADVMPFSGVLAQAEADDTVPTEELDLDELIAQGTDFDTDSVFVDLGRVGDYFGIYEYGDPVVTENVAAELELLTADAEDPDGDGPIVTDEDAAERFLLDGRCNGVLALAVRKQVTRPLLATILRPDAGALQEEEPEEGAEPAVRAAAVETDPFGIEHTLPLQSTVEIGRITVSVLDLDLVRARPPALLSQLVAGDTTVGAALGADQTTPDAVAAPEFFETVWTDCLVKAAEEGTLPVPQTIRGEPAWTLLKDPAPSETPSLTADTDVVTWLEDHDTVDLEIRIETSFQNVSDGLRVDPAVDLPTDVWLEVFADPAEPGVEVASQIIGRRLDVTDVLAREAFTPPADLEYGEEIAGVEAAARNALRAGEVSLESLIAQADALVAGAASAAASGAPADTEAADPAEQIRRVMAKPLYPPSANETNARRRLSEPPNGFFVDPLAIVQTVIWDPDFLNSDAFRRGWKQGIAEEAELFVDVDDPEFQAATGLTPTALDEAEIVAAVGSITEGVFRFHWITPCYTASIAGPAASSASIGALGDRLIEAQNQARAEVFGPRLDLFVETEGPELGNADLDYRLRQLLFDLERAEREQEEAGPVVVGPNLGDLIRDHELAREKFIAERDEEIEEAEAAERALEDEARIAFCSASNLEAHLGGEPVDDFDDNGVADHLPENEAARLAEEGVTEELEEADDPAGG